MQQTEALAPPSELRGQRVGAIQRTLLLKTFPGFAGLSPGDMAMLASITQEREFAAGALMHTPGKPVTAFHLIVDGTVDIYRHGVVAQQLGPRSSAGALAALTQDPGGAHVVATSDVLALEIDADDMDDVFEDNFHILLGVLQAIAGTLRDLQVQRGGGPVIDTNADLYHIPLEQPLTLVQRMFFARNMGPMSRASIEAIADIAREAVEERVPAGHVLWKTGDAAEHSFNVVNGIVACESPDGATFEFPPGYNIGGLDAICGKPRWYRATAKTDCRLLRNRNAAFFDMLEDHHETATALLRSFASGLSQMVEQVAKRRASELPEP